MPWFHELLTSISRAHARSRPRLAIRAVAAALSVVLLVGAVTPGFALASEADSEQEGSASPGALPGLEEGPELEPGGEETVLEAGAASGGEEGEEGPPLESEPAQESEPPPPPEAPPATEAPPEPEEPPSGPTYSPAEPAAQAPSAPVENEPLPAPESPRPAPQAQPEAGAEGTVPEAPPPASLPEAPEPEAAQPPALPAGPGDAAGSLAGQPVHVIRAGECLWSIAEALLPGGADNAEIAAEVQRLWKLNAQRIGTGDPSVVYAGTKLRLR